MILRYDLRNGKVMLDLAEGRDSWRAVMNAVMNIRVTKYARNLLQSENLLDFLEVPCSVELVS